MSVCLSPCYPMIVIINVVLIILTKFTVKLFRPACHGKIPWKTHNNILKMTRYSVKLANLHVNSLWVFAPLLAVLAYCSPTCPLAALAVIVCVNSWNRQHSETSEPSQEKCRNNFSLKVFSWIYIFSKRYNAVQLH